MTTLIAPDEPPALLRVSAKRRVLRSESSVGLTPISDAERRAARIPLLALLGISWFSRGTYLDAFYSTIDAEYTGFVTLSVPRKEKVAIAPRVAAAIRTIAAFSAWYPVIWAFVARGLVLAVIAAVAVAGAIGYFTFRASWDPVAAGITAATAVAAFVVAGRLLLSLPRRWPSDVLALVLISAVLATLAQVAYALPLHFWAQASIQVAASGVAVMCFATAVVLSVAQGASQLVTWRKISGFPEEEIIETTAVVAAALDRTQAAARTPEARSMAAQNMEWIARRFEGNLTARYATGDPGVDAAMRSDAARCAAAFRARRRELVFPSSSSQQHVFLFLWNALQAEALGRWGELPRGTPPEAAARPVSRAIAVAKTIAAIGLPAAVALVVQQFNVLGMDAALQRNIVITGITWSVLALLSAVNPRQFETQASTAKTLGELLKKP